VQHGTIVNRIAGVVRFSYPAHNGFSRASGGLAKRRAMLYDEARLVRRFRLFEALTLPSLIAQRDAGFDTVVLTGTDLPVWARERLDAGIARLPGGRVLALPPMSHYPAIRAAFAAVVAPGDTHLTSFRLDDDDAIDRDLVARLRRLSADLLGICGPDRPFVMGFNRGFFVDIGQARNILRDVVERLPLGIGLAMTAPVASGENIFRRNHRLLPQFYPTFTEADTPAFVRSVHGDNDSSALSSGVASGGMTDAEIAAAMERHFPFTVDDLLTLGR
jgi:hypothetical protein